MALTCQTDSRIADASRSWQAACNIDVTGYSLTAEFIMGGFDIQEGDCGLLTAIEGPSSDGSGYADKRAILLDQKFTRNGIDQTWWVIGME